MLTIPDWLERWLYAALAAVSGGVAWFFTGWRADRIRRELTQQKIVEKLEENLKERNAKVESLLVDAYAREKETAELRARRLAMDNDLASLLVKVAAALERRDGR